MVFVVLILILLFCLVFNVLVFMVLDTRIVWALLYPCPPFAWFFIRSSRVQLKSKNSFLITVEPKIKEEALSGDGFHPIALKAFRCCRAEIEIHLAIRIGFQLVIRIQPGHLIVNTHRARFSVVKPLCPVLVRSVSPLPQFLTVRARIPSGIYSRTTK